MAGKVGKNTLREIDKSILQLAFERFNVIIQRDTFLSNRILNYVRYEFLVNGILNEDTPDYMRELLIASGSSLVDQITALTRQNPQEANLDLAQAQRMNTTSLLTVAEISIDPYVEMICRLTAELGLDNEAGVSGINLAGCAEMSKNVSLEHKSKAHDCRKLSRNGRDKESYRECLNIVYASGKTQSDYYLNLLGFDDNIPEGSANDDTNPSNNMLLADQNMSRRDNSKNAHCFILSRRGKDRAKYRECLEDVFSGNKDYLSLLGFQETIESRNSIELSYRNQQSFNREKTTLRAKYCIQALGFIAKYTLFKDICDGVILESQLSEMAKFDGITTDANFNNLFNLSKDSHERSTRTQDDEHRICAFRDHLRKNHVYFMVNSAR